MVQRVNINSVHNEKSSLFHWFGITLQILETTMSTILLHLFWITLLAPALSWHLSGFAPLHAPVGQVAVWRNRAYICVPRYDLGTVTATLLEASWPETMNSSHKATQQVQPTFSSPKKLRFDRCQSMAERVTFHGNVLKCLHFVRTSIKFMNFKY